jgi:hypothetical protein
LNDGLDFLRTDQETAKPHRVADPGLKDEARLCNVSEIAGPENAIGIDRPRRR